MPWLTGYGPLFYALEDLIWSIVSCRITTHAAKFLAATMSIMERTELFRSGATGVHRIKPVVCLIILVIVSLMKGVFRCKPTRLVTNHMLGLPTMVHGNTASPLAVAVAGM